MLIIISPMLSSLHSYSPHVYPHFLNTWQKVTGKIGQLEAVRLNLDDSMVCVEDERKKIELETTKMCGKDNSTAWKKKTNKLADRITAALVICEEHMSNYHDKAQAYCPARLGRRTSPTILKRRICQITGTKWMHP